MTDDVPKKKEKTVRIPIEIEVTDDINKKRYGPKSKINCVI